MEITKSIAHEYRHAFQIYYARLMNDDNETVWLTQAQMAELFDKSKSTINEQINSIYDERELLESETMRKFGISELSTKPTYFYNLDVIISVGYRVKSLRVSPVTVVRFREYAEINFIKENP